MQGNSEDINRGKQRRGGAFPPTNWHLLRQAAADVSDSQSRAYEALLETYLPVITGYLIGVRRFPPSLAEDLTQGFITAKVLKGRLFQKADPLRGRFRNLVLRSLNNYVASQLARNGRDPLKDVGDAAIPDQPVAPDQRQAFDVRWAREVVRMSISAMKLECEAKNRLDIWEVFSCRVVQPSFEDAPDVPYDELVRRFGFSSPREVINIVTTGKRMFQRCLRAEVARYAQHEEDADSEIADLRAILFRTRNLADPGW